MQSMRPAHFGDAAMTSKAEQIRSSAVRACIVGVIASVAIAALGGVLLAVGDLSDDSGLIAVRVLLTGLVGIWTSLALLGGVSSFRVMSVRPYAGAAILAATLAAPLWLFVLWRDWDTFNDFDAAWRLTITLTILTLAMDVIAMCFALHVRLGWLRVLRWISVSLLIVDLGFIMLLVWELIDLSSMQGFGPVWDFVMAALLASFVSVVLLTGTVVLIRLTSRSVIASAESIPMRLILRLTCPMCAAQQVMSPGPTQCNACGQRLLIDIEEPRCECGYLLFRLTGNVCPECGRGVPPGVGWRNAGEDPAS
jgi:hypothetical protein